MYTEAIMQDQEKQQYIGSRSNQSNKTEKWS